MAKKWNMLENLALLSHIGIMMIIPIIGGVYAGRWIDNKFNTQPVFLFVCIIAGVAVAFINLFKVTMRGNGRKGKRK